MVSQNVSQEVNTRCLIGFLILAVVICTIRTVARWWKAHAFQVEDLFIWLAVIFFLAMGICTIEVIPLLYRSLAVTAGTEPPWPTMLDDITWGLKVFFPHMVFFWATLWSVKFSLLWMFRRLIIGLPNYQRIWLAITIFTLCAFIGCIVSHFTSCSSMTAWFTPGGCQLPQDSINKAASLWYSLAVDLLTDMLIMTIPIRLLWNLQISRIEKICVGFAFSVGIITMLFAIIRVISLDTTSGSSTHEVNTTWLILWAGVEGFVAILVGSLPAFAVFIRSKVVGSKMSNTGNTYESQPESKNKSKIRTESVLLEDLDPPAETWSNSRSMKNSSWLREPEPSDEEQAVKVGRGY